MNASIICPFLLLTLNSLYLGNRYYYWGIRRMYTFIQTCLCRIPHSGQTENYIYQQVSDCLCLPRALLSFWSALWCVLLLWIALVGISCIRSPTLLARQRHHAIQPDTQGKYRLRTKPITLWSTPRSTLNHALQYANLTLPRLRGLGIIQPSVTKPKMLCINDAVTPDWPGTHFIIVSHIIV